MIKEGGSLHAVANAVEKRILDLGASLAFPVNIAINDVAAHYTPSRNDPLVFLRGDVVKLDVGAHLDGYIADTALTVEVGTNRWTTLIHSSEEALEKALDMVRPGVLTSDIGAVVERTIASMGYKPIENLTGHGLKRYNLHADPSIPNVGGGRGVPLEEGMTVAIEPFSTNGGGYVEGTKPGNIYHLVRERVPKNKALVPVYEEITRNHGHLPFAERWLKTADNASLSKLTRWGTIAPYTILVEGEGGMVAQKEHTILVTEDGCEVLTR